MTLELFANGTLSDQNISSGLNFTTSQDTTGNISYFSIRLKLAQVTGNTNYIIWTEVENVVYYPKSTLAVESGVTTCYLSLDKIFVKTNEVVKWYVKGAGTDTTTPDLAWQVYADNMSSGDIANVWGADPADYVSEDDTFGQYLGTTLKSDVADSVWDEDPAGHAPGTGTLADFIGAIVADTDELQTDLTNGGRLDALIDLILADTAELQTDWVNGGRLDLLIDAILEDTATTLPATLSGLNDLSTTEAGDAVLDEVVEGTLTLRQIARLLLAVLAGKSSGGGTTTIAFRDQADTKDRISATVEADGDRTAVSVDGT